MKKLFIILALFTCFKAFGQTPTSPTPVNQMTWYKDLAGHMWAYRGTTLGWIQIVDASQLTSGLTNANNGLSLSGTIVQLGGNLIKTTTIGGPFDFNIYNGTPGSGNLGFLGVQSGTASFNYINQLTGIDRKSYGLTAAPFAITMFAQRQDDANSIKINMNTDGLNIIDDINSKGATYNADYSAVGTLDDRWIPDWGAVKSRIDSLASGAVDSATIANTYVPYTGANANLNLGNRTTTSGGEFVYPSIGQPLTTYKNAAYTAQSFVGMQGSPEVNVSFNMDYNQPGKVGVHQYSDPSLASIWYAAGGGEGWKMQYAPSGVTQTGVGALTFTGGSGYTDGTYTLTASGGTGTGEALKLIISGSVVTSCVSVHIGEGYTVGDVLSVTGIGPGSGFSATVTSLFSDIWYRSGQNMFVRGDPSTGTLTLSATGLSNPVVGAGVQVERSTGRASMSGTTISNGFVLNGHPTAGSAAPVYINSDNTGTSFISGGNGAAQFGSINTIAANVKYNFLGSQSATISASGLKFGVSLTPVANGQVLTEAQFTPTFNAGTGALTATITTAVTSLSDGIYDNLSSTATSGSGSGQTWKITVSGGNVITIVPATSATGGSGYAVGNTFTVNTVTGAVFTVATLGYTGTVFTSAQFNTAPIQLASLGNPTNPAVGMLYSTGTSLRFYNGAITVVGLQSGVGANTQVPIFNSSGLLVPTTPTGTGAPVLQTSPTFVTPALGTPVSGVMTNVTGLPTTGLVNNAVTYAKMQAMTTNKLLGSGLGTAVSEITLGTNLSFTGSTLNASGFANPMTTLGDIIYGGASGISTRLAGNITTTPRFLSSTGNGTVSAAPTFYDLYNTDATWGGLNNIFSNGLRSNAQTDIYGSLTIRTDHSLAFYTTGGNTLTLGAAPTGTRGQTFSDADGVIPATLKASATLDFTSTASQTSSELTITVAGAADGDPVTLGVPNASTNANSCYTAWVSSAGTVTVKFNNYSSGAIDPASGTFKVTVFK